MSRKEESLIKQAVQFRPCDHHKRKIILKHFGKKILRLSDFIKQILFGRNYAGFSCKNKLAHFMLYSLGKCK